MDPLNLLHGPHRGQTSGSVEAEEPRGAGPSQEVPGRPQPHESTRQRGTCAQTPPGRCLTPPASAEARPALTCSSWRGSLGPDSAPGPCQLLGSSPRLPYHQENQPGTFFTHEKQQALWAAFVFIRGSLGLSGGSPDQRALK